LDTEEEILFGITLWQFENVAVVPNDPLDWQPPQIASQRLNVSVLLFGLKTKHLGSPYQIVSPKNHFHGGGVGPKTPSRYLSHRKGVFEFAD
jgi:hypothetical protein